MSRKNNPYLKKAHEPIELNFEKIEELKKCLVSPIHFIENYVKITHPVRGRIPFKMYDYQRDIVNNYVENRYNIVLSARQTGKTETSAAFLLWYAIFHDDKTILVVSKDADSAMEIIKRIQEGYEGLPDWLKPGIQDDNWNKGTAAFDNRSRIVARSTTETSGRGLSISLLYCDELAFVKAHIQQEFWGAISPTLSTGGKMIITSTPNGDIDLFSTLWKGAEAGSNNFHSRRVYWDDPPGRDEEFKESEIKNIGEHKWRQEYECEFISSDSSLFDSRVIQRAEKIVENIPIAFTIEEQDFYKPISQDMTYLIGVDPATGSGADYSVIEVFEFPSMYQVLEWRENTVSEVVLYSHLKKVIGFLEKYSNDVYFSVESNGVGRAVIALYMQDERPPMYAHFMSEPGKNKLGFTTTATSKRDCAIRFKNMFERDEMLIYSKILYKEMKTYIRKADGFRAQTGSTDDCISALFVIIRMLDEISMYDPRAYAKLYKFEDQADGDEWYTEQEYEEMPLAGGAL